ALAAEGLLPPERFAEFLAADGTPTYAAELGEAIHTYLARSRARLMLVQLEDVAGESEQANLPGTTEDHPNWRRRLSVPLDDILAGSELRRLAGSVNAARRQARPETDRE
ncbi:MAG TPA: 4-alpha-glucanotransferase, partial [Stellaceae bacterium]|nr:4-alpha-glucanotransferase [Stellaceae bacterium]